MLDKEEKEEIEKWAEQLLKDRDKLERDKEFDNILLYGSTHPWLQPNTFVKLPDGTLKTEYLSREQVIERYGYLLTEEQKAKLLKDGE